MPRTALVSCYANGKHDHWESFLTFATHLSTLLKAAGDEVCVIVACKEEHGFRLDSGWQQNFQSRDIDVIQLQLPLPKDISPDIWAVRMSEQVAPLLWGFDVVYFSDWANLAFHTVRAKRFSRDRMPVCVTVLQGSSNCPRICRRDQLQIPLDLHIDFIERYSVLHSDLVVALGQEALQRSKSEAWQFRGDPHVLEMTHTSNSSGARLDRQGANEEWLRFHKFAYQQCQAFLPASEIVKEPSVDVCVPYYNKPRHFPQLLESLEHQTIQNFTVIAVDDGSTDPDARAVFQSMAEKYRPRGWTFFNQPNSWVDAARNQAAKHGTAEYILMVDADDVPAQNTIERMLDAARLSGDDYLVSGSCLFAGDGFPYDTKTLEMAEPVFGYYMPLGASLVSGLLEPEIFGGSMILVRRKTFEALGGYRELRGVAHEDWELHARLSLAGYRSDVVPEYLHFYRQIEDGLARTSEDFLAKQRIIESYERYLAPLKLHGAAIAMYSLYCRCRDLENRIQDPDGRLAATRESGWPPRLTREDNSGPHRFATNDEGSFVARMLRRAYRRSIPLSVRLRLHENLLKLLGREQQE